jgi:hypothetical protein
LLQPSVLLAFFPDFPVTFPAGRIADWTNRFLAVHAAQFRHGKADANPLSAPSNASIEFLTEAHLHLFHSYLTPSALICIEDPEGHIQNKEIVLVLRRILWIWKD